MTANRTVPRGRETRGQPIYVGELEDVMRDTHLMMRWECIGARCSQCERESWLDRDKLERGASSLILYEVAKRLRCRSCGNRAGNKIFLGRLPRD
ncbi:hypothetical protein ASG58_20115 [Rhizobium sp. Leaf383]|nr:hypothetical protein ASG58_20115 [Rhizobium sp. Leaf383]